MKPLLLDLFCGAGGCTKGYQDAGFEVWGVDLSPQPNYCGDHFTQMDALEVEPWFMAAFDAIHASPPCQHYANVTRWRGNVDDHPDLIGPIRDRIEATGLPWVIENVRTRAIRWDYILCGSTFGLPVRRHRYFETNWSGTAMASPCQHRSTDLAFEHKQERAYADAMGCDWMTSHEAREAIPPAYTEFIGTQLAAQLGLAVAA